MVLTGNNLVFLGLMHKVSDIIRENHAFKTGKKVVTLVTFAFRIYVSSFDLL